MKHRRILAISVLTVLVVPLAAGFGYSQHETVLKVESGTWGNTSFLMLPGSSTIKLEKLSKPDDWEVDVVPGSIDSSDKGFRYVEAGNGYKKAYKVVLHVKPSKDSKKPRTVSLFFSGSTSNSSSGSELEVKHSQSTDFRVNPVHPSEGSKKVSSSLSGHSLNKIVRDFKDGIDSSVSGSENRVSSFTAPVTGLFTTLPSSLSALFFTANILVWITVLLVFFRRRRT